jgi:hypothetical protein
MNWKIADRNGVCGIGMVVLIAIANAWYSLLPIQLPWSKVFWRLCFGAGSGDGWNMGYVGVFWWLQIGICTFFASALRRKWLARSK